jgi:hypothetical protein
MKYTVAGITQDQYIRVGPEKKIVISPKGGDFSDKEAAQIYANPYGKKLIDDGVLKIEGFTPPADKTKDGPAVAGPKTTGPGPAEKK